ncbi:hypothetical protein L598_005200000070 [Mesorhizobium sp. J18]|nr:hypothetical protein L598_005200000070 [Mesorhizobium sp. J18]
MRLCSNINDYCTQGIVRLADYLRINSMNAADRALACVGGSVNTITDKRGRNRSDHVRRLIVGTLQEPEIGYFAEVP